jgi:hypothetical protein
MVEYNKIVYREEKEIIPRRYCTPNLLKLLREEGFGTDGYEHSLEEILTGKGFGLPEKEDGYFIFRVNEFLRMYLVYADSLAQGILLLRELKLF